MPKVNTDGHLGCIIDQYNLKRNQALRQNVSWENKTYNNSKANIILNLEDNELQVEGSLSMEWEEFVVDFLVTTYSQGL